MLNPNHPKKRKIEMQSNCPHVSNANVALPGSRSVQKDECLKCFDSWDDEDGIQVCLKCYQGGCQAQGHAKLHSLTSGHPIVCRIKRVETVRFFSFGFLVLN
jgi:ubiquitin carboxyl-terminal hydrolase 5/13